MTKNSYAQFNDVRAYHDDKTGDIHLTIKDSRFTDGFKLTLNAGRKEEMALRSILEAENKLTPLPESNLPERALYEYHMPSLNSAPQEGEFQGYSYKTVSDCLKRMLDGNHIPLGATGEGRFDNAFWNVALDQHMLVAGGKKSGLVAFLRSVVNFTSTHSDKWQSVVIDGGNNKISNDKNQNATTISEASKILSDLYSFITSEQREYVLPAERFNTDSRTVVIIHDIEKLRPVNPKTWDEIISYERLLTMIRKLEGLTSNNFVHMIFSSENFTTEAMADVRPYKYARRLVIGKVPVEVSEFILGKDNDAGVRIPRIPGRAITIQHHLMSYVDNRDNDPAIKDSMQEIQTFDLVRD